MRTPSQILLLPLFFGLTGALPLAGQDIELLGEIYGTRPPDAYFEQMQRDPNSYRFSSEGEGRARLERLRQSPMLRTVVPGGAAALAIGPRDGPMVGTFRFPLVLGLVSDGPPVAPYSVERVQEEYFDGPNSYDDSQTVQEFYLAMSRGLFQFEGTAYPWIQTNLPQGDVTLGPNVKGLQPHESLGVGTFIERILDGLDDGSIDWSRYDMSGDGYVDVLAVMHPFRGAECSAIRDTDHPAGYIHSHRWSVVAATGGPGISRFSSVRTGRPRDGFETSTPYAGGGNIHINDYTIQPLLSCESFDPPAGPFNINQIGVFSHELGHALGLPDLYNTSDARIAGSGNWDLMGTGAWGCPSGSDPARPCQMGAWSKEALGWVEIEEIGADALIDVVLAPVQSSGRVLRVPALDGSGEYLLLENRQRIGSDVNLLEPGLLVWHIDPIWVEPLWPQNRVNAFPSRMGVWLRQADGLNHLEVVGGNRADRGDPFPGCTLPGGNPFEPCQLNQEFHVASSPAAITHQGRAMGIALTGIALSGPAPHDVTFRIDTRFSWGSLFAEETIEAAKEQDVGFSVAGVPPEVLTWRLLSGGLPSGLEFDAATARIRGLTLEVGSFEIVLGASDGATQETEVHVTLDVIPPVLAQGELVAWFLGLENPLSFPVREFLDIHGNQNSNFDLGDVRAYLQANPGAPVHAGAGPASAMVIVDPRRTTGPERRREP